MHSPCHRRLTPGRAILFAGLFAVAAMPSTAGAADDAHKLAMQDFRSFCASCHGHKGGGDGPVATVLKVSPPDLTTIARRNGGAFPADTVYETVDGVDMPDAHGTRQMPVWGIWFTYEAISDSLVTGDARPTDERVAKRIRGLVAYLETLQE